KQIRDQVTVTGQCISEADRGIWLLAETEPRGQDLKLGSASRQAMGLQTRSDLEFMFDVAQEQIGRGKLASPLRAHIAVCAKTIQCTESPRRPQTWIAAPVNQCQRLNDEFELADAAVTKLHVALERIW